jgi:hypothetical protein
VDLIIHLGLELKLGMHGVIPPLPHGVMIKHVIKHRDCLHGVKLFASLSLLDMGRLAQWFLLGSVFVTLSDVVLGGVMVSVLAIGPKVRGFKPSRRWIFKGD